MTRNKTSQMVLPAQSLMIKRSVLASAWLLCAWLLLCAGATPAAAAQPARQVMADMAGMDEPTVQPSHPPGETGRPRVNVQAIRFFH